MLLRLLYEVLPQYKIIASPVRQKQKNYDLVLGQSRLQIDILSQKLKPMLGTVAHANNVSIWKVEV